MDRGTSTDFYVVTGYELMTMGQSTAIVQVRACHAVVGKKTNKVLSAYQDEELNTYSMLSGSALKTDSSVKIFDVKGKARYMTRAVSDEARIGPFVQTVNSPDAAPAVNNGTRN